MGLTYQRMPLCFKNQSASENKRSSAQELSVQMAQTLTESSPNHK